MSSTWEWAEMVSSEHDEEKPFAPENGQPLKFKVGDRVIYTNDNGVKFKVRVSALYERKRFDDAMYTTGHRYLLEWGCPWFPVAESSLEHDPD